MYEFVADATSL